MLWRGEGVVFFLRRKSVCCPKEEWVAAPQWEEKK